MKNSHIRKNVDCTSSVFLRSVRYIKLYVLLDTQVLAVLSLSLIFAFWKWSFLHRIRGLFTNIFCCISCNTVLSSIIIKKISV